MNITSDARYACNMMPGVHLRLIASFKWYWHPVRQQEISELAFIEEKSKKNAFETSIASLTNQIAKTKQQITQQKYSEKFSMYYCTDSFCNIHFGAKND